MQAIFETLFDILYLTTVITLGIRMLRGCGGKCRGKACIENWLVNTRKQPHLSF